MVQERLDITIRRTSLWMCVHCGCTCRGCAPVADVRPLPVVPDVRDPSRPGGSVHISYRRGEVHRHTIASPPPHSLPRMISPSTHQTKKWHWKPVKQRGT